MKILHWPENFLELLYSLTFCYPLSLPYFKGVRLGPQFEDSACLFDSCPFSFTGISPNKSLLCMSNTILRFES